MTTGSARSLVIGSRGSDLALWQAKFVQQMLGIPTTIKVIKTSGDTIQHLSLDKVEGKGFFTKEIELALLSRQIDIAVHSLKDLPTEDVDGLRIGAIPPRASALDVLIVRKDAQLQDTGKQPLRRNARIGTSSLRRQAHLKTIRPDIELVGIRGNVPTRIEKIQGMALDGIILAQAGVERLGEHLSGVLSAYDVVPLAPELICPAPGQGALGIQIRTEDQHALRYVKPLHCENTSMSVSAERGLLAKFGGGCHLPLGCLCRPQKQGYSFHAVIASIEPLQRLTASAASDSITALIEETHHKLVEQGAAELLG
ncbi:MAG: hydroxymethylbilane synthase [Myxococcota bacterium]|nr:hydroxymethylbilane synthase [Myxococcota bacterium]